MIQLLPALMRTVVPLVYGLLISLGLGHYLPDETITTVATVLILAAIYLILRLLEHLQPWIGVLLGWARQPQYAGVVAGEVIDVRDQVETAARSALEQLRDDVLGAVEAKIQTSVASTVKAEMAAATKAVVKSRAAAASKPAKG